MVWGPLYVLKQFLFAELNWWWEPSRSSPELNLCSHCSSFPQQLPRAWGSLKPTPIHRKEVVAFQMDNRQFVNLQNASSKWAVQSISEKTASCKFWIPYLPLGKAMVRNGMHMFLAPVHKGKPPALPIQCAQYTQCTTLLYNRYHRGSKTAFRRDIFSVMFVISRP